MALPLKSWLNHALSENKECADANVCIVSLVGKSPLGSRFQASDLFNFYLNRDAFGLCRDVKERVLASLHAFSAQNVDSCGEGSDSTEDDLGLEVFYDADSQTILIHAVSCWDTNELFHSFRHQTSTKSEEPNAKQENEGFFQSWSKKELHMAKQMLYIFSVSHIVLFANPSCSFDVGLVRLFKAVDSVRQKLIQPIGDVLRTISSTFSTIDGGKVLVSKQWLQHARPCSPRALFCFRKPTLRTDLGGAGATAADGRKRDPYGRLERALEDQIFRILRKARIITNVSINSLFSVPSNRQFVYVMSPTEEITDTQTFLLDHVQKICSNESGYVSETGGAAHSDDESMPSDAFYSFLRQHVDIAHDSGFNDNRGRVPAPMVFELPTLKSFVKIAGAVLDFFVKPAIKFSPFDQLSSLLNVEIGFSQSRCNKVYSVALGAYTDGLPPYYSKAQHEVRLAQALQLLRCHARGPAVLETSKKLLAECEQHWTKERQACDAVSCTGNPCVHKVHVTQPTSAQDLPVMSHNSRVRYLSTCNCGYSQAMREDPFYVKEANYTFYQSADFLCCRKVQHMEFAVYEPNTTTTASDHANTEDESSDNAKNDANLALVLAKRNRTLSAALDRTGQLMEKLKLQSQGSQEEIGEQGEQQGENSSIVELNPDRDNKAPQFAISNETTKPDTTAQTSEAITTTALQSSIIALKITSRSNSKEDGEVGALKTQQSDATNEHLTTENESVSERCGSSVLSDLLQDDAYFSSHDKQMTENEEEAIVEGILGISGRQRKLSSAERSAENEDPCVDERPATDNSEETDADAMNNCSIVSRKDSRDSTDEQQLALLDQEEYAVVNSQPVAVESTTIGEADDKPVKLSTDDVMEKISVAAQKKLSSVARSGSTEPDLNRSEPISKEEVEFELKLPPMLTNHTPSGILPRFSSWSLVCIGHSSVYSHSNGLRDMPNFSHGTSWLLPWDVQLRVDLQRWQQRMDLMIQNRKGGPPPRKPQRMKGKEDEAFVTVKLFIGYEYECPRGHRFMLQTPEKTLKHAGPGGPKEGSNAIMKSDMPLWFPCSCRITKPALLAQLMRLHIVTPKAPVLITLMPRVQPSLTQPVIFLASSTQSLVLEPSLYYILRFPFVYVSEHGPIYPPKDQAPTGRMLKGPICVLPNL